MYFLRERESLFFAVYQMFHEIYGKGIKVLYCIVCMIPNPFHKYENAIINRAIISLIIRVRETYRM